MAINKTEKKDCNNIDWSYEKGKNGPENWKNICEDFIDCGGNAQSPVNIITKNLINDKKLTIPIFNYKNSKTEIINDSHTIRFNIYGNNSINLNGKNYKLLQFHYHALSEHTIDGKYFPLELHLVHKHSDRDFAVIGIMFIEGKDNILFSKYLEKFPVQKGKYITDETINLSTLFPANKSYYYYKGSLTTPPCREIVDWYLLTNPMEASKKQIDTFSKILNNNYREVFPLNNRNIKLFNEQNQT